MKCEYIKELMSAYIDNEINEVDKAKFEKHIAQCPQCKEEYELLKEIVIECSEIHEVELPEDFREELHAKLLEAKRNKPNRFTEFVARNKWKTASGVVAAVLIVAIALNPPGLTKSENTAQAPSMEPSPYIGMSDDMARGEAEMKSFAAPSTPEAAPAPTLAPPSLTDVATVDRGQVGVTFTGGVAGDANRNFVKAEESEATDRKIIKNGSISLKVADVQNRMQEIRALATGTGGYEESSYIDNIVQPEVIVREDLKTKETTTKVANMTIRVPSASFESTYQTITAMGKLVSQNTNSNDVTNQYKDIEARVTNLQVQEKHLQEIMAKATTVEDIMKVESELNRVRTEIDMMTGSLKRWDAQVEYSTIYINMTEVKEAELEKVDVPGVWQKAQQGFIKTINTLQSSIESLVVFIVSVLPYIIILGAGSLLAVLWMKRKKK